MLLANWYPIIPGPSSSHAYMLLVPLADIHTHKCQHRTTEWVRRGITITQCMTMYVAGVCVSHTPWAHKKRVRKALSTSESLRVTVPSHHVRFCKSDKVGSLPVPVSAITGIPTPRWHTLRPLTQPSAKRNAANKSNDS